MTTCTYSFTGADGKPTVITGKAAFKAYLLDGGLQQLMPRILRSERAADLEPKDVLKPETIAAAEAAIAKYKKAEPPDPLTAKERAHGEKLLEPLFDAARRNKPEFDKTLTKIAEDVNGKAKLPGIKKPHRAVTKLAIENAWDTASMKDLLRGTIVVGSVEDAQKVIDAIGAVYEFDRIKNRLSVDLEDPKGESLKGRPLPTGYQDVLTNVKLEDGTVAEIQISTPAMIAAKHLGHEIYAFEREMPESPVKAKMVDLQKTIYAEGANFGRAANASKTSANSALSMGSAFSRTSEGLRGEASGTQAVADRQSGETVTGTSFQSKNMVPGGRDLKSNFIGTSKPIISESRRAQKNPAASRVNTTSASRFERTEALKQGVSDLQEGKITQDEYNRMVDELRPVYPYEAVPPVTTKEEATYALSNGRGQSPEKAAKYGLPSKELKAGDFAQLRLDIPSYQQHDAWVVSVHTPKSTNTAVQAAYDAGTVIGYESVAAVTDASFGMNQKVAAKIATGTAKGTIATVFGKWKPISAAAAKVRADAAIKDPAWTQVGMDPFRHSYFYDRDTMRPVLTADEVIQIGPLVLAKNATFSEDNKDVTGSPILFSKRVTETPNFKRWFGDSKVVDENGEPLVVYHGSPVRDFTVFNVEKINANDPDGPFNGFFFSSSKKDAESAGRFPWARPNADDAQTRAFYLSIKNPATRKQAKAIAREIEDALYDARQFQENYPGARSLQDATRQELQKRGYDGIVFEPYVSPSKEAFERDGRVKLGKNASELVLSKDGYVELYERGELITDYIDFDAAMNALKHGVFIAFRPEQIKSATDNNGEFSPTNPSILASQRVGRETEGWITSRDAVGRLRFGAGAKAYRAVADVANSLLEKTPLIGSLKPASPELSRYMRQMKAEVANARDLTADVAKNLSEIPEDQRQMISDVIEGELAVGIVPPQRVLELAASMQSLMTEQSEELVRLKMLTPEAAGRWDGKYLPRFYEQTLKSEAQGWVKAVKNLMARQRTMQGIGGSSLKGRGLFETIPVEDLNDWIAEGWEVRDANFDPAKDDVIGVWRDYTKDERENMGEIRDAMFRFVMGYMKSQRDIALGRLYERLATEVASRTEKEGFVQVPSSNVEDTTAKRYGALAGKWVPQEVLDHLTANDTDMDGALLKIYRSGLSKWKEGKTVLNPVAHANNVISNLTMAHFAGVSYWDGLKYFGALKDLVAGSDMVKEAKEAGLFGGTFTQEELVNMLPDELKELAGKTESQAAKLGNLAWNIASLGLRKPLSAAYEGEDLFFRYLIYRDARKRGVDVEDAIDYAQKFIFTYDDLPKGARTIRDAPIGIPFFSWTFKAMPILAQTAAEHPWRFAGPAAVVMTANAMAYAIAAGASGGSGDDDWWTLAKRYIMDPEFRARANAMEKEERKNLPEWQKGKSIFGTEKTVRLGMDELTGLPLFLDISRIFPGGDMGDFNNNTGGLPLPAWLTPNNPVLSAVSALLLNRDAFTGKDVVSNKLDTPSEKAAKWGEWAYKQIAPAVAPFNYHFDRTMNALANATGKDINLGFREYTGTDKMGQPVQAKYAAMQTVGIKVRPTDLEVAQDIADSERKKLVSEINKQIKAVRRAEDRGFYTGKRADELIERLETKRDNLKEGLTITGEEPK